MAMRGYITIIVMKSLKSTQHSLEKAPSTEADFTLEYQTTELTTDRREQALI
jgi:hypothetical protein